jgi:hypothetical protein
VLDSLVSKHFWGELDITLTQQHLRNVFAGYGAVESVTMSMTGIAAIRQTRPRQRSLHWTEACSRGAGSGSTKPARRLLTTAPTIYGAGIIGGIGCERQIGRLRSFLGTLRMDSF